LASWTTQAEVAAPVAPARRRRAQARPHARARGGVLWIAVSAVLLAGVVFVNVGVLQLNLRLDDASHRRAKLRAENAALQSELSSLLASPRIQARARQQYGLEPAESTGYLDLSR
jgi:cell division protein FtsL